jgi:RHS repeat-associated protein
LRRSDYLPYGEEVPSGLGGRTLAGYGADGGVRQSFTGQMRDGETGLDYFGARFYSGALGRFTSADEVFADQDPSDPMSWNLMAYVRNNPLRYTDPTGRGCVAQSNPQAGDAAKAGAILWSNSAFVPGPSCGEIDKADQELKPSVVVNGGKDGARSAVTEALLAFFFGGPKQIEYGPDDPFTRSFQRSIGMDAIVEGVTKNCKQESGRLSVGTEEAFVNALIDGIVGGMGFYNPNAQLGAFNATYRRSAGTLNVTVTNPISLNSAAYHATSILGIANPKNGPLGTVYQTIHVQAKDPCRSQ